MQHKPTAPVRDVTDVGPGDYVKIGVTWKRITSNSAQGALQLPRHWTVETEDGGVYGMFGINLYAKAEDLAST